MAHAAQKSLDLPQLFMGVMVHDGTTDGHRHIFGSVNWANIVEVGVAPSRPAPMAAPGAAILTTHTMRHALPPHAGEGVGGELGRHSVVLQAPPGMPGNIPMQKVNFSSHNHGVHRDDLAASLWAVSNGGAIKAVLAIVMAVHYDASLVLISEGEGNTGELCGGAAVALDLEAGEGALALGVLGARRKALKGVTLMAGEAQLPIEVAKGDLDEADEAGLCGVVTFAFDPGLLPKDAPVRIAADLGKQGEWTAAMVPLAAGEAAKGESDCKPSSVKATKWGAWKPTEDEAAEAAFKAARSAADKACDGNCPKGRCAYKETATELLETEEKKDGANMVYRSKVKTEGKCECR